MAVPLLGATPVYRRARWCAVLLSGALLFGCARGADTEARNPARRALAAAEEPVLLTVVGNPFAMDAARLNALISTELAAGISGMSTQFTTSPEQAAAPEPRAVVVLNPLIEVAPETLCLAPESIPTGPVTDRLRIAAAFCEGDRVLGFARTEDTVAGPTDQRFRRLLWRTARVLIPDDYEETYGFGILPRWLDFGIGGSIGE
jgi:hypothetical protein